MGIILSRRGRDIKSKIDLKRRLEEKYMLAKAPLSNDEQEQVRRIFDNIRRQLDSIGR